MYGHKAVKQYALNGCLVVMLLWAATASAQLEIGDNLSMRMNGSLGYGYSGAFGNYTSSTHGQGIGANANIDGYYFHPNFLKFDVRPYFDRSSSNSESQSITRGTGIGASVGLFGATSFPGSVTYGLDFSSNSEYFVAGLPSVLGNSSGHNFSITWAEILPKYPHLYVNFNTSSGVSSLLSATNESRNSSKNLNMNSDYRLAGFDLRANFNHNANKFTTPTFLTGQEVNFEGSGTSYGVTAQHKIPLGGMSIGWSHSTYEGSQGTSGSGNNYFENVGILPTRRLSLSESFNYTTNLTSLFTQSNTNGVIPILFQDHNSYGMFFFSNATYVIGKGLTASGNFAHRRQSFFGEDHSDSQYGGTINYHNSNRFLGFMNYSVGMVDIANKEGNAGAGLIAGVGMNKKIKHWETSADFNYTQNLQTQIGFGTTSSYSYGGSVRRKINAETHWSGNYRASHSGLTMVSGSSSSSRGYGSSLSWRKYSVSGNYSQSSGIAVLNVNGEITSNPLGGLFPSDAYVFNATSWGVNGSTRFFKRLSVSGGYSDVSSSTFQGLTGAIASGSHYNFQAQYILRKFSLQGGFSRAEQSVSVLPGGPRIINSYFFTLARWFNVF